MKRALITGSTGFLGRRLTEQLQSRYELLTPARNQLDISDPPAVLAYFEEHKPHIVVHLAAAVRVDIPPLEMKSINVDGTRHVFQAAKQANCAAVVVAGSCAEYGNAPTPFTEDARATPLSDYAKTKLESTRIALESGLPVSVLRMTNVYGPDSKSDLIARLLYAAKTGSRVRVSDSLMRDYVYVTDVIDAFERAIEQIDSAKGNIFNISSSVAISTLELARIAARILGIDADKLVADEKYEPSAADQLSNLSSNAKARDMLGWEPHVSLAEGLRMSFGGADASR